MHYGMSMRSAEVVSASCRMRDLNRALMTGQQKARRQLTAAHALACYRCCLPALAGFTGLRCAGPAPDLLHLTISDRRRGGSEGGARMPMIDGKMLK